MLAAFNEHFLSYTWVSIFLSLHTWGFRIAGIVVSVLDAVHSALLGRRFSFPWMFGRLDIGCWTLDVGCWMLSAYRKDERGENCDQ